MRTALYRTVCGTVVRYLCSKPRMFGSKCKSRGDGAGVSGLFKILSCKIRNVFLLCLFLCIVCVRSVINLLQCSVT